MSVLERVAAAIADGLPVDWSALDLAGLDDPERDRLRELRLTADISNFHAPLRGPCRQPGEYGVFAVPRGARAESMGLAASHRGDWPRSLWRRLPSIRSAARPRGRTQADSTGRRRPRRTERWSSRKGVSRPGCGIPAW